MVHTLSYFIDSAVPLSRTYYRPEHYCKPGVHMTVVFLHRIETNITIEFHIEEDNGNYIGKYSQSTMCNYLTRHELELSHLY
jgi:hypothetical protein